MTATVVWPDTLLAPRSVTAEPQYATLDGGRGVTAVEEIGDSGGGYWKIIFSEIPVVSRQQKRQWRLIAALLEGRLGTCSVPVYIEGQDGITATARSAPAVGTSVMTLRVTAGVLSAGQEFTMVGPTGNPRLHRIVGINSITPGSGHTDYGLQIFPSARFVPTIGQTCDFTDPRCLCNLLTDDEMGSAADDYAGRGLGKITWVEAR